MGLDFEKCFECMYSDECGTCKKGFKGFNGDCYFESRYILDDETGEVVYSEDFEEDEIEE